MIVVDEGLTAEQFRADPEHRQALDAFLKTKTGALMMHVLNEASQPVVKELRFPQDRLQELHSSEHRALMGVRRAASLIRTMAKPLATGGENQRPDPNQLGVQRTEEELEKRVPKFQVPDKSEPTQPPTT